MDHQRTKEDNQAVDMVETNHPDIQESTENARERKKNRKRPRTARRKQAGGMVFLHFLQHVSLVMAAVLIATLLAGCYVVVDTRNGAQVYNLIGEERNSSFEDSDLFNSLLGNSLFDVICYGAIRGQLETDGRYDPAKEIDVTAYADRYNGVQTEYITARYYLDDLLKWARAGFESEDVYMSGQEADQFLSRKRTVTRVDLDQYSGGTVGYFNSDLTGVTHVVDVSGNQWESGESLREDTNATVLKNRYHTVEGKNIEDYVSSWDEYYELCDNVKKAAEDLNINYEEYQKHGEYYDSGDSNIFYVIARTIGDEVQVCGNLKTGDLEFSKLKEIFERNGCGKYLFFDGEKSVFETNTRIEESTLRYILNGFEYAYPENTRIMIGVDTDYHAQDCFYQARERFGNYVPYLWQYAAWGGVCILIYLALLVLLTMREGRMRRKDTGEIMAGLGSEDYIPTEIMAVAAGAVFAGLFFGISRTVNAIWRSVDTEFLILFAAAAALVFSLLFSFFYYSFVRRIRAGILWRGSLLRRLIRLFKKWVLYSYDHSGIILRVWAPFGGFVLLNVGGVLLGAFLASQTGRDAFLLVFTIVVLLLDGAVGYMMYRSALARQRILEGIELIREGNLAHKVSEEGIYGDELVLARAVNSIGESVKNAVETSMRDERMKSDLITNVSHDIKTPLTSIINYVDLIKRENVSDPRIREYIEVLDAKSQRLKQLTDDLVEASKISSGNIVLHWEKINLVELLNQTIGEFSEKFEEKALYPVFNAPKGSVFIEADSRRIWRIIENLFNNIFKYALAGTRVYIDLEFTEKEKIKLVVLSVKNISAQPLKVSPEELTERFIRGDESRTTEGSGLGLSIAKNLTEVQRGKFEIVMDGDLFKVNLIFPLLSGPASE